MKTKAIRLYGVNDLRLDEFELPEMKETEIFAEIFSDSICMSTYKAAIQGAAHKRVPEDIDKNPVIVGHEFCGIIRKVGAKWKDKYKEGEKFVMQTALNYKGSLAAPGYSYRYVGGEATFVVIPEEVMLMDCLIPYHGKAFFYGSLAEPMSCIVGGFHGNYHIKQGTYIHEMGIKDGGCLAILAGAGPMGLGAIDYAIHADRHPSLLVVTDLDQARLDRASSILTVEEAKKCGVELHYVNTGAIENAEEYLKSLTKGHGYDDVYVFAPVKPVVEMGD
ncbi:MAG: alcohol dehydrogenase catalytic domain-containing protein, partial [Lachnospiraceae bacterium]|nr:alcohol dehydrogenase catalytic domain-containing protein [Lachnospiraceae bacterium]